MGKSGGRELNYVSDVDVIFVAEPRRRGRRARGGRRRPPRLATHLMRVCSESTGEGTLWEVDANLRPEGKNGPARAHPRQPPRLLRALGQDLGVPGAAQGAARGRRPGARGGLRRRRHADGVAGRRARELRRRRAGHAPPRRASTSRPAEADRQLKLGPGGLRDVEFTVQLLQLVHGRSRRLAAQRHARSTRSRRWPRGGYVGRERRGPARRLRTASCASLEHRIQLYRLRRTHLMPAAEADLRRLGRSLGHRADAAPRPCEAQWQRTLARCAACTRSSSTGRCCAAVAQLRTRARRASTPEAAQERLAALGFRDPPARCGTSRR